MTDLAGLTAAASTAATTNNDHAGLSAWAALVGAIASVLAAAAAWAAVRQAREIVRESRRPHLVAQHLEANDGTVRFLIQNVGGGAVLSSHLAITSSGRLFWGLIGEGVIAPGESWRLITGVPMSGDKAYGVLYGQDPQGAFYAWSMGRGMKRWRKAPGLNAEGYFRTFYKHEPYAASMLVRPGAEMVFQRAVDDPP